MPGGRPRKEINWEMIAELAGIRLTMREIVRVSGMAWETLTDNCPKDNGISFSEFYEQAKALGDSSIRRKQYQLALAGNVPMLIWLGKQMGQSDKVESKSTMEVYEARALSPEDHQAIAIEYKKLDEEI